MARLISRPFSASISKPPWLRAVIFTVVVPGVIAGWAPLWIAGSNRLQLGWWQIGWLFVAAGAAIYFSCLLSFLAAKGTPAIFFTRHLRAVLGEEPHATVRNGLYRYSRNPMYVGVLTVIFGQAMLFASGAIGSYGVIVFVFFQAIVTLAEEPHLRKRDGPAFDAYCREVPRWLGLPRSRK